MEIDLKEQIIKVLKESKDSLSPFQIFNSLVMKDHIHNSIKDHLEIEDIRLICKILAHDGILIEKEPGLYTCNPETGTSDTMVSKIKKINRQKKLAFLI